MRPIVLTANRPADRFYRGGARIASFRGGDSAATHEPEDWVASTTTVAAQPALGLTTLPDGRLLVDAVSADPTAWLGDAHVARYGADTRLLVKLLDAGQRLPVHAHPDGDFARSHLARAHGKAEAWYIIDGGEIHLGLTRNVGRHELLDLVSSQDTEALLSLLHRRTVRRGDVVYVPPGVLHAIGEGVFLFEVQEPEDLSILLEWKGFALDGDRDGHLGLGFERALSAVESRARTASELDALIRSDCTGASVLPQEADAYFRLECHHVDGSVELAPGFAVLAVLSGALRLGGGAVLDLPAGTTAIAPHAAGGLRVEGRGELLVARPPLP